MYWIQPCKYVNEYPIAVDGEYLYYRIFCLYLFSFYHLRWYHNKSFVQYTTISYKLIKYELFVLATL